MPSVQLGTIVACMATSTEESRNIAASVSAALQDRRIAQRTVSAETGIPMTTFVRKITGKTPFDVAELAAIAGLLDVSIAALITYAGADEQVSA